MEERRLDIAIIEWLTNYKKNSVKTLTYDRLLISYRLMEEYDISRMSVNSVEADDIQEYLNKLVRDGYSISTIKKQFNLISAYWKWGMSQHRIETPVYLGVKLPNETKVVFQKRDIQTYSFLEQRALMAEMSNLTKQSYAAGILMLEEGLRAGETLALKWSDILWTKRAVRIHRTLIRMSSETTTFVQEYPKSKSSIRTIPLNDISFEALLVIAEKRKAVSEDGFIFARSDRADLPCSYSSLEFHIRKLCRDLGIKYKGLHAFRHTFATNCYERGCDVKILSKLLGHSDVAITYNTYIHLYGDALEEMRKVMG